MMISTKGRYALRVMLDLASQPSEEYISLKAISDRQEVSMKYLEAIVAPMVRAEIIRSQRGKEGGYQLARPAEEITIGEILRCSEGTLVPVACPVLDGGDCEREGDCQTLPLWQALDRRIDDYLNSVSLKDLVLGNV